MELLNKFAAVQIEADKRISKEDRAFCQRQQEAFDKSGVALKKLAALMKSIIEEQKRTFSGHDDDISGYLSTGKSNVCNVEYVHDALMHRNVAFIHNIVRYFARKYNVELDEGIIQNHMIPAKPKEPRIFDIMCRRNLTSEELEDFKKQSEMHKHEVNLWEETQLALPLKYEKIVDEIFVQLGGFSFEERAMNEFLERTWEACHYRYENSRCNIKKDDERFEIKNAVLRIPDGCNCDENKWMSHPEPVFKPTNDLVTLIDALAWYQCGRMNEGCLWVPDLGNEWSSTKESIIYTRNMSKVESIKLFKNGRVDIKFRSAAFAQEFAEQCLRRRPSKAVNN